MATIRGLYRRVKAMQMDQVIEKVFEEKKDDLLEINKKQLFEGFDNKGQRLKKYRSAKYARVKNELNPLPGLGNPDYFVTGKFYKGWTVIVSRDELKNQFKDDKSEKLLERTPGIAGLTGDYKSEFIKEHLQPAYLSGIRQATGL